MKQHGFTLIELITVLAIISVLASVSYPVYTQHIIKTRRIQAEISLLDLASSMERFYVMHHNYADAPEPQNENPSYQIKIVTADEQSYLLQAIPQNSQKQDIACGSLGFDGTGLKTISGNGKIADCW